MALDRHRIELAGEDERGHGDGGVALDLVRVRIRVRVRARARIRVRVGVRVVALDNAPALECTAKGELGLALHACVDGEVRFFWRARPPAWAPG